MKSIMNKVCLLAGILLACASLSHATTGVSQSSVTVPFIQGTSVQPIPAFLIRHGKSVYAQVVSTAGSGTPASLTDGTTVNIEASTNMTNWVVVASTASGIQGRINVSSFTFAPVAVDTYYRFNVLASSNCPLNLTFRENDDVVQGFKNNRGQDNVIMNDDSLNVFGTLKPNRFQFQQHASTEVNNLVKISSYTQFVLGPLGAAPKQYSLSFSSNIQLLESNLVLVTYTDAPSSSTMLSTPVISTQTATNGDIITFIVQNSTVAFNSDNITANTGLKLGASTRSVQPGGVLQLIFCNGFWRELFFANNNQ